MGWRRFYLGLALLMVVIAIARLVTGNVIGAIIPLILAVVFGSTATEYPLVTRARQVLRLLLQQKRNKGD